MDFSIFVRMKILLINPPRSPENNILRYAPEEAKPFIHRKLIGPPLGLLTIAAAVKDYDVTVFDIKGEYDLDQDTPPLPELILKLLRTYKPNVVGITVITSEYNSSMEILQYVKLFNPEILTVAGGLHATLCIRDFAGTPADVVIPGQCPHLFRNLIQAREHEQLISGIAGIYLNSSDGFHKTKGKPQKWDVADANYLRPDRGHLKRWIETYKVGDSPFPSTYIFTSLGCPYKCTFCSIWTQFKGQYFQRSTESLIEELKTLDDYPVVRFADANTVVDEDFMAHLFDRIREEGIEKTFIMDIRADVASRNPAIIRKMSEGGLKVVICGFESFRDTELKKYNKRAPASDNLDAIKVFDDNGIMVRGNYVIPCDYNAEDFSLLSEYADKNRVVYAGYTILSPMPGTVYYQQVRRKIIENNYDKYNFFNALMKTSLPYEKFHEEVGKLWLLKKGTDVI